MPFALALIVELSLGSIRVTGSTPCPTPEEVLEHLEGEQPEALRDVADQLLTLERVTDHVLRIRLSDATEGELAVHDLRMTGTCSERARAISLAVAIWESQLSAGKAPRAFLTPPPPSEEAPPRAAVGVASAPPAPWLFRLSVGGSASVSGGSVSPELSVQGSLGSRRNGWGGAIEVSGAGSHDLALGPGTVRWQRLNLSGGPRYRLAGGALSAEGGASFAGTLISIRGEGYDQNVSNLVLDVGAAVWARGMVSWGWAEAWLGATGVVWPRRPELAVSGLAVTSRLPLVDLALGGGLSRAW